MEETPVIDAEIKPVSEAEVKTTENSKPEQPKESPAKGLREVQFLLENGMFPGNVAPSIKRGWELLDKLAAKVEQDAGYVKENKA
jgi:hypothetical protein